MLKVLIYLLTFGFCFLGCLLQYRGLGDNSYKKNSLKNPFHFHPFCDFHNLWVFISTALEEELAC